MVGGSNPPGRTLRSGFDVAEEIAEASARLLGDSLVAVILHGSLTFGDYVPGLSDVDLLAVVERPLSDAELAGLTELVTGVSARARSSLDFRVVTREAAGVPTASPAMELYVGLHDRAEIVTRAAGERDLVAEFSMVRSHGRRLVGAEPRSVVGAVPDDWVVALGDDVLARWQRLSDDAPSAELMMLTACRIWRFRADGVHCSKTEAGRWALARNPSLSAVEAALRRRESSQPVHVDPEDIARVLALARSDKNRR